MTQFKTRTEDVFGSVVRFADILPSYMRCVSLKMSEGSTSGSIATDMNGRAPICRKYDDQAPSLTAGHAGCVKS